MNRLLSSALSLIVLCLVSSCKTKPIIEIGGKEMDASLIRSHFEAKEVTRLCENAISEATQNLNRIAKLSPPEQNFENTLLAFEKINADFSDSVLPLMFMGYVSTNENVNKEGADCEQKVNQFSVSIFTRKDLYEAIKNQKSSSKPEARLLSETLKAFEDNGLKLPDEKLNQFRELKQKLASIESQFSANLNQDKSTIEFALSDLKGLPQDFIDSLAKTSGGKYIVTTKEPHYMRIMENASESETRRKMLEIFENRVSKENTKLLEEAIQLRKQIATLMGYKTWLDYRIHTRMAKNSETVLNFLTGLKIKLSQRNAEDLSKLLKLKKEQDPSATELKAWDLRYYAYQLKKRDYQLDDEVIKEYFPADQVVTGMFQVYSKLLGLRYVEKKDELVWADGVKLYQIYDQHNNELIGYFYTDFIPRNGKYGHAAAFPLILGRTLPSKRYSHPVSAIVANFSPPEKGKPILLKHEEVRTLFHEFGHIMHQTITQAPYASLSGSSVDQDFVEAPSQMLENWVFAPEILNSISGHYKDIHQKLPKKLLEQIIKARDFNQGYFYTRQLLFGLLDTNYHTSQDPIDTAQLYRSLHKELIGVEAAVNSHFPASFGHLMGGYDAGYYGYLWSEVYAQDMFTLFKKAGLLNSKVGQKYRKNILEKGKMEDAFQILQDFLGRKPNANAFYKKLHLE